MATATDMLFDVARSSLRKKTNLCGITQCARPAKAILRSNDTCTSKTIKVVTIEAHCISSTSISHTMNCITGMSTRHISRSSDKLTAYI